MKSPSTRLVFDYWDKLRGSRAAPERSEIEPGAIREALADSFVIEIENGTPLFRLAGTRVAALFGRELKGTGFFDLWTDPVGREEVMRLVGTVTQESAGAVVNFIGETGAGERVQIEMVLLPLKHRGGTQARIMGALSPLAMPTWFGFAPVVRLRTISVRLIWPEGLLRNLASAVVRRARFVVHEGGLR